MTTKKADMIRRIGVDSDGRPVTIIEYGPDHFEVMHGDRCVAVNVSLRKAGKDFDRFNIMDDYCVDFLNSVQDQDVLPEEVQSRVKHSVINCLTHGFYLAYSKKTGKWRLSNKSAETLQNRKDTLTEALALLFTAVE